MTTRTRTPWTVAILTLALLGGVDRLPGAAAPAPEDMVLIEPGRFQMGAAGTDDDAVPVHEVQLDAFYLDRHEVTNAQFAAFVVATGHVTQAERDGTCWAYVAGATDFQALSGADWRHPEGPTASIESRPDHPVVCVSWDDATAYARWAGKRLPTEAEWEYAARGGSDKHFEATVALDPETTEGGHHHGHATAGTHEQSPTRDASPSSKSHAVAAVHGVHKSRPANVDFVRANVWEGTWPATNTLADGYYYSAPWGRFAANSFGLYDMIGNVWEWTADWYAADYYAMSTTHAPVGPDQGEYRVARGGSWFCSPNYCGAYSTYYRGASPRNHAFNNVGFRCAKDID